MFKNTMAVIIICMTQGYDTFYFIIIYLFIFFLLCCNIKSKSEVNPYALNYIVLTSDTSFSY